MKKILATVAVAGAIATGAVQAHQARGQGPGQVRDMSQAPPTGAAGMSGVVVTDEQTPQPIRNAAVTVQNPEVGVTRTTFTDSAGRFSLTGLPAGRYSLIASKSPYLRMNYGAKRPEVSGTTIALTGNGQATDLVMRLPKGSVISGRVVDENGEPTLGVNVRLMQSRFQNGERTLVAPASGVSNDRTDDRGVFRMYGLPAGEYVVIATPPSTNGEIRAMTEDEIRSIMLALQQQQAARAQAQQAAVGGYAVPSPTPSPTPTPNVQKVTIAYAPVYYPGTTSASGASMVTVGPGEERGGVDIALRLVRTAKVEGTVLVPEGIAPQSVQLTMLPASQVGAGTATAMAALEQQLIRPVTVGPDGKFAYTAVAPGTYVISARATKGTGPVPPPPPPPPPVGAPGMVTQTFTRSVVVAGGGDLGDLVFDGIRVGSPGDPNVVQYWGQVEVPVDGVPVSGVTIPLQPGMTITGKVEFRSVMTRPGADFKNVQLNVTPMEASGGRRVQIGGASMKIDENGQFTIVGVTPGRYRINGSVSAPQQGPSAGPPWRIGSQIVKGRDALDFPFEVLPGEDISGAVVTFTDATQQINGVLQDATGRPATDYTIVAFPTDKALWGSTRRIKTVRPSTDGKFTLTQLPAGEYVLAAVTDLANGEQNDSTFLEQVLPAGIKVTLAVGETKTQVMRISGGL